MTADELRIDFCGDVRVVPPGASITFGRAGDIQIDETRFLHRILGEFTTRHGLWWVENVGSSISFTINDRATTSFAKVAPGTALPLGFEASTVRFEAGGRSYELDVEQARQPHARPSADTDLPVDATELTTTTSSLPLTDEQRQLLEALAAPVLAGTSLPTNREIASSLGWTITKYNRKLDGLCSKYTKAGITGLRGSSDQLATDRRLRLAQHVIDAGIVGGSDA